MSIICPVCDSCSTVREQVYKANSEMLLGRHIQSCTSCKIGFVHPLPNAAEWHDYNASYFEAAHGGINRAPITVAYNAAIAKIRLRHITDSLIAHAITPKRVLEIGPGEGYLASAFMEEFPETHYNVLESDTSVHETLRDIGVKILEDPKAEVGHLGYDLVIISHVLEHTLNPIASLGEMTAGLRPGGLLFVEVPCRDFVYKSEHEPHVMFFTKASLGYVGYAVGCVDIDVTFHGDTVKNILRFDFIRRVLVKLSVLTKVSFALGFRPNAADCKKYNLTDLQRLAVSQTRPFATQKTQARWLRMLAIKGSSIP